MNILQFQVGSNILWTTIQMLQRIWQEILWRVINARQKRTKPNALTGILYPSNLYQFYITYSLHFKDFATVLAVDSFGSSASFFVTSSSSLPILSCSVVPSNDTVFSSPKDVEGAAGNTSSEWANNLKKAQNSFTTTSYMMCHKPLAIINMLKVRTIPWQVPLPGYR